MRERIVAKASGFAVLVGLSVAFLTGAAAAQSCSGMSLGPLGSLNGFVPSPKDAWHEQVEGAPVDPSSTAIIDHIGASHLHHDFSSAGGAGYGIPYTVVDSSMTPPTAWTDLSYKDESDIAYYPIPPRMPIEGKPGNCPTDTNDRHAIILDRHACVLYELYQAKYCSATNPVWSASNGAMWDMTETEQRPVGYTSVDAAGLSVFEGLIRYDEVQAGAINHAIRFTVPFTKCGHYPNGQYGDAEFVPPATHGACNNGGTGNIMGMRIRLKADFDISRFSRTNQIILTAMKKYGMILADNGGALYFQGTPDPRWNDDDLENLNRVPNTAFEVVQMPRVQTAEDLPREPEPAIEGFIASPRSIAKGQSVTLTPIVKNASYMYIDKVGFIRGPVKVTPTETATYTLTASNGRGRKTKSVTVRVEAGR